MMVVLLTGFLALYNNATNLLRLPDRWYIPANLVVGGLLVLSARVAGLGWADLGLAPTAVMAGVAWGVGVAMVVAAALGVGSRLACARPLLDDRRVAGMSSRELAYTTLFRIPIGTAAFEELAFRGVLLALWASQTSLARAVLVSSVVFGVWHIGPTMVTLRTNAVALDGRGWAVIAGSVAVTTLAGVGLCLLRLHTGSLLAPVIAHVATNSFGTVAAFLAQRTTGVRR